MPGGPNSSTPFGGSTPGRVCRVWGEVVECRGEGVECRGEGIGTAVFENVIKAFPESSSESFGAWGGGPNSSTPFGGSPCV